MITRVIIPPDPQLANCTSTIIDTQEGDATMTDALSLSGTYNRLGSKGSLSSIPSTGSTDSIPSAQNVASLNRPPAASHLAAGSPYRNVDAIILVYDLDRSETFDRLSNHWLPLIDKCYDGKMPVIIAGNKMDLQSACVSAPASTENQLSIRSRQEIIALLQRFMFVRQCIKCSAKNLLNIDEVFKKAQQAVLYPIAPLYDLNTGWLTAACTRALSRIFRIFDKDSDGLLNDAELNSFQQEVWGVTLMERDVSSWKKVVVEHDLFCRSTAEGGDVGPRSNPVLSEGKFTLQGFLTIFDVFISQNRLEVPWKCLRCFGYDDELNLTIPSAMSESDDYNVVVASDWRLSAEEESFLTNMFHLYDCDKDGVLSSDEIRNMFSVLSHPLPPWSERGKDLFRGCPSMPRIENEETSPTSSMIGVPFDATLEMSPLPPTARDISPDSPSMLSASGITISSSPLPSIDVSKDTTPPSETLGSKPISYLAWMNHWHMLSTFSPSICRVELYRLGYDVCNPNDHSKRGPAPSRYRQGSRVDPRSSATVPPKIKMPTLFVRALIIGNEESGCANLIRKLHGGSHVFDVALRQPETTCSVSKILLPNRNRKDDEAGVKTVVHYIFTHITLGESTDVDSTDKLTYLLEQGVYDMAVLVYNSSESFESVKQFEADRLNEKMPRIFVSTASNQLSQAINHCRVTKLESPRVVDVEKPQIDPEFTEYLVDFTQRPHRDRSKRRKLVWLGCLVTAGITVVLGLTIGRKRKTGYEKSWLKSFLDLVAY